MPARRCRRVCRGQSLTEFAIVGGLFFFLVFAAIDFGLMMFVNNAASQSAQMGMITLADEGTTPSADTDSVQSIVSAGIGTTGIGTLDEIDVYKTYVCDQQSPSNPSVCTTPTLQPDGTIIVDTNGCTGGVACVNQYSASGTCLNTCPWPASARSNRLASITTMGVTLKYHFDYLGIKWPRQSFTQTRYFRVEPRSP
ncbi:MAG: pilus assembly protein [Candidatus Dormibacteraeota bacterium]|nr:pilus assembly protein [Candidatus Dormibacteraeota bacterium]